jgi:hypothetical protein
MLQAQLAAWAARRGGAWREVRAGEVAGHFLDRGGVVVCVARLDEEACELTLSGEGGEAVVVSVTLSSPPYLFSPDASSWSEAANGALERGTVPGAPPLDAALTALFDTAARTPALAAALGLGGGWEGEEEEREGCDEDCSGAEDGSGSSDDAYDANDYYDAGCDDEHCSEVRTWRARLCCAPPFVQAHRPHSFGALSVRRGRGEHADSRLLLAAP